MRSLRAVHRMAVLLPAIAGVIVALTATMAWASAPSPYITPPAPPATQPGPVGPISTPANPINMFGPLQTVSTAGQGKAAPNDQGACQLQPSATNLGSSMSYFGRVACAGTVGYTEIEICPAKYYSGAWHTFSGTRCRENSGYNGTSVGTTQGCNDNYDYRTWAWDYIPEATPSTVVANSAGEICG
jgi:hypothetical protein